MKTGGSPKGTWIGKRTISIVQIISQVAVIIGTAIKFFEFFM